MSKEPKSDQAELPKGRQSYWWLCSAARTLAAAAFAVIPYLPSFQTLPFVKSTVSTAITWTVFQTAAVLALVIVTLYCVGRARLERAAYRANRIDIQVFADERKEGADRDLDSVSGLTASFKRILNDSRLYTPTAVPGVGGSYDFIQIVESAGEAAEGWCRAAARLVKLAQPPAAFRITGTIRPGNSSGKCQLILELVRAPRSRPVR